jgi:GT2 family glycosyltransferase
LNKNVPVSVVIPTWKRTEQLLKTLGRIHECDPLPAEVLIHVDAGDEEGARIIRESYPDAVVLLSASRAGAVGGRRKLVQRASHEIIVGLDDDSWPMEKGFFGDVIRMMKSLPDQVAIVACSIVHRGEDPPPRTTKVRKSATFIGCGAIFRRSAVLHVGGYTPVVFGHGFEEADLSLRLWDEGHLILASEGLRVFHDTDLAHHVSPSVNGAQITNTALLSFLRYPWWMQWYGLLQILNRVVYSIRMRRIRGIIGGLMAIPAECRRLWKSRLPVKSRTVFMYRRLSRA